MNPQPTRLAQVLAALSPRRSLRARVGLAFGGLIILLTILLSLLVERPAETLIEDAAGRSLSAAAFQITERLNRKILERSKDLQILATLDLIRDPAVSPSAKRALLEELQGTYADMAWIGLADVDGTVQVSTQDRFVGDSVAQFRWFEQARHAIYLEPGWEQLATPGDSAAFVTIAAPVLGPDQQLAGVLAGLVSWAWMPDAEASLFATFIDPGQATLFILSEDGRVEYGPDEQRLPDLSLASASAAKEGKSGFLAENWPDEQAYLIGYAHNAPYPNFPELGWLVLIRQRLSQAFAPVQTLQRRILLYGTSLSFVFILLGWLLADRIIRPLTAIATAADEIGKGDTDVEIPLIRGNSEVAMLSRSLHNMVDELNAQTVALEASRREMEQRVIDRTRKLSALYGVLKVMSPVEDLNAALTQSLDQILDAARTNIGFIHLLDRTQDTLTMAARGGIQEPAVRQLNTLPITSDPVGWVARHNQPLFVLRMEADKRTRDLARLTGLTVYAGAAIASGDRVWGVLSLLGADSAQFTDEEKELVVSVAEQIAVVLENVRLRQQSEQLAVIEERNRLARELHDSITQSLYSMTLLAEAGRRAIETNDLALSTDYLAEIGETAQQSLKEMRLLLHKLRPAALEKEGLVHALQHRLASVEERSGIHSQLTVEGSLELSPDLEEALYYLSREALNNALKHANAGHVFVGLRALENDQVELIVQDNGRGFDPEEAKKGAGLGLSGMHERAERAGGRVEIRSAPGEGTTVRICLPIKAAPVSAGLADPLA